MPGFVADPGTNFATGDEAEIARRLDELGKKLGVTIYGISGYRTPARSVEVGGTANDPHTKGLAADIGVGGSTRASAAKLTDAQLASVGLFRPIPGNSQEINHIALLKASAPLHGPHPTVPIIGSAVNAAKSTVSTVSDAVGVLTDPHTWLRVIEVVIGALLILMGLKSFTGGDIDPLGAVARHVPVPV